MGGPYSEVNSNFIERAGSLAGCRPSRARTRKSAEHSRRLGGQRLAPPTEHCKPRTAYRALQASHRLQSSASLAPPTEPCKPRTAYRALQASHRLQSSADLPPPTARLCRALGALHCLLGIAYLALPAARLHRASGDFALPATRLHRASGDFALPTMRSLTDVLAPHSLMMTLSQSFRE